MLDQANNTSVNETTAAVPATATQAAVPATAVRTPAAYASLVGRFKRDTGSGNLPQGASTGCTIIGSSIMFGVEMDQDAGDFIYIYPENVTEYEKVSLGIAKPTQDEKKFEVSCYDGETVQFGEQSFTKSEFIAYLKEAGYPKAQFKNRAMLHGFYLGCDREDRVTLGEDDNLFTVYLSPSSLKAWKGFLMKSGIGKNRNNLDALKLGKRGNSFNGNNWTEFTFQRAPEYNQKAIELLEAA